MGKMPQASPPPHSVAGHRHTEPCLQPCRTLQKEEGILQRPGQPCHTLHWQKKKKKTPRCLETCLLPCHKGGEDLAFCGQPTPLPEAVAKSRPVMVRRAMSGSMAMQGQGSVSMSVSMSMLILSLEIVGASLVQQ